MAVNRIFIQVDFQSQSANAAIDGLNQNLKSIGTAAEQSTNKASSGVKGFSVSIDQTTRSLEQLATAAAGLGLARVTQQLVMMGDQLNRIQRAFANSAGGAQAFQEIQKIAEATRFSFEDLAASANQLRNFGVAVKDIPGVMRAFAGAVEAAGLNTDDLTAAVHAFGQMTSQQFVNAKSVYQSFGAVGLQIMQMIREQTHKTVQQVREDTRLISTEVLAQMIVIQAQIKALEAAPRGGDGATARFSQLKTAVNELAQALDEALGPSLVKVLGLVESLVHGLTDLTKALKDVPEPIKDIGVGLGALVAAVVSIAAALSLVFAVFRPILSLFAALRTAVAGAEIAGTVAEAGGALAAIAALPLAPVLATIAGIIGGVAILMSLGDEAEKKVPPKDQRDKKIEELKAQQAQLSKGLYVPDEKKGEEAAKRAADLLDEAQRRSLMIGKESIAALTYAYREHFRSVAGYAKAEAMVRQALEIDIATEGKKADEERRKDHLKNLEELSALQRKVDIAQLRVTPDDTFAGRARDAQAAAAAYEADILHRRDFENQAYDRTAQLQIDSLKAMGGHAAEIAEFEKRMAENRVETNAIADLKVKEHRLDSERETNLLLEEQRKQQADQDLQDRIAAIEQAKNLRVAALGAVTPESLPDRLRQIREVTAAQIQATQQTRDARIAAARAEYDYFRQQHPGAQDAIDEEFAKFEHTRITTARDAEVEIQLERINLWKESNDAIIAEQRKVYEGIKSALDTVWNALLNKSQSVWQALGNALKTAVLNAMKEIVTSRLAATIAGMFGYGTYTFKRGIPGITEPPSPSGLGIPLAIPSIGAGGGGMVSGSGSGQGSADRYVGDEIAQTVRGAAQARGSADAWDETPSGRQAPAAAARTQMQQSIARLRDSLGIGKPITAQDPTHDAKGNPIAAGGTIPWSMATSGQRLGAILKSPAAAQFGLATGAMLTLAGLRHGGPGGGAEAIAGATLAGVSAASLFPALGLTYAGGALLGAGLGVAAYGLQRGGKVGLGMDIGGLALAGGVLGTAVFPGLGTLAGAAIGAGVGAVAGLLRMAFPTINERIRSEIKRVYGIDIPNAAIRKQIADIITQKYGGNLSIGIYSQDVQEIVRLFALSSGQGIGGLPRPMYSATFAQSQAGGLQLQPVYSNGQLIANPYVGTTTTQVANALATPPVFLQLHPQQAVDLFAGQVVKVVGTNPGVVGAANATAARSGQSRLAQTTALMEPATVTR